MQSRGSHPTHAKARVFLLGFAIGVLVFTSSCSTVKVKAVRGSVTREGIASAEQLRALPLVAVPEEAGTSVGEVCAGLLHEARRFDRTGRPDRAAAKYLRVAVLAHEQISAGNFGETSGSREALFNLHNHSLARFAELWSSDTPGGKVRTMTDGPDGIPCDGDLYEIVMAPENDFPGYYFDRAVATESIRGKGVVDKHRWGIGAALVGIRDKTPGREEELKFFSPKGVHVPATLVITDVSGEGDRTRVTMGLIDPTQREKIRIGSTEFPLAADFSAPLELQLQGKNEILWGLSGFFDAKEHAERSGIYLIEPYDPDRIPVILTHGLIAVPIIWRDIVPEITSEPDLARKYQLMVFTYPSSFHIAHSAHLFREELDQLRATYDPDGSDPLSQNMVAMGHSMGGILTRLLVAEMDQHLWNEVATLPSEQLQVEEEQRRFLTDMLIFDADPAVQRAVFISTPHQGAELATLSAADVVSRLAKFPTDVLKTVSSLAEGPPIPGIRVDVGKKVTSVQSLRPDSPVVLAMQKAPFRSGVVYHSIIGDRGKNDSPDSSDGVVEYWSSHLPGASSELVVPTGHSSYEDPGAIEEIKRILRVHAAGR